LRVDSASETVCYIPEAWIEHRFPPGTYSTLVRAASDELQIGVESPQQPEVLALLAASDAYMAGLYPAESNHLLSAEALTRPEVTFLVARISGEAVACGALVDSGQGWAELKRMYVTPAARGKGLGRRILRELENIAATHAIPRLRLETGVSQPEALALYRSAGFVEIDPFGSYLPDPLSLFMEKTLTEAR